MSHLDLQSGYLAPGALGTCTTWVSTTRQSYLLR